MQKQPLGGINRALVIEDNAGLVAQLSRTLETLDFECDITTDLQDGLFWIAAKKYQVCFVSITSKNFEGLDYIKEIKASFPSQVIIHLSGAVTHLRRSGEAMRRGSADFLPQPVNVIKLQNKLIKAGVKVGARSQLTNRERDVLTLVVCGMTNAQIAKRLEITTNTVKTHRGRINEKVRDAGVSLETFAQMTTG